MNKIILTTLFLVITVSCVWSDQLAFPTAEGYGKFTTGGRGGKVIEVTNLNDTGTGSLRAAIEASGPRTIVFRVSGTIELTRELKISNPYITIAGQTAPGDGICISQYPLVINADEVIVRYIRVRMGDEAGNESDAISGRYHKNIMIDHVSASWSVDETISIYHCENVTVQWCIVSESLYLSNHEKGTHGYGGIWGSNYSTYHHNLLAHHTSRNPRFASGCGNNDYRNNVLYNWGFNSCYGAEKVQQNSSEFTFSNINMVANYYKPGPATKSGSTRYKIAQPSSRDKQNDYGKWYVADNFVHGSAKVTANNWDGGIQPDDGSPAISWLKLEEPWSAMPIDQHTAEEAYVLVLQNAGASLPQRDAVDLRIVDETINAYATYGASYGAKKGIIDSQADVGGWPELNSLQPPTDTDHDGMPDDWETAKGLNPNDDTDRNEIGDGGYTNLEIYLNELVSNGGPVTQLNLSPMADTIETGNTTQLWALIEPVNASNKELLWESSDTTVAIVNSFGLVKGIGAGTAIITVTTDDGAFSATSEIEVLGDNSNVGFKSLGNFSIYPVPCKDFLNVHLGEGHFETFNISILDITGKIIFQKKAVGSSHRFDVTEIKSGLYLLKIVGQDFSITESVIVAK
ncbi:MAG: Ig-like domain-containing protein [Prolixibacteraceae bacterium]|nr:Ig-like domain-containing protein [Prolixibacteraceae bacterium]